MTRVLFLGKVREGYWGGSGSDLSSGLKNSISFVVQMLNKNGIDALFLQLADNNKIDAAVATYKPTHCILEAYWVVASKMDQLLPLHPTVRWSVRNHSEWAFLQNEGIAAEWSEGFLRRGMELQSNSPRTVSDMACLARAWGCDPALSSWAPNWYPLDDFVNRRPAHWKEPGVVNIGLFGAIRPLKSHLCQAVASLRFAEHLGRRLKLHVNSSRIEGYGAPALKNLIALFSKTPNAELVQHEWLEREDFLPIMAGMDYSLQCSFSETFNIVSSDAVQMRVPVVASPQIPWLPRSHTVDPNDSEAICAKLLEAEAARSSNAWLWEQWCGLKEYIDHSESNWLDRYT